MLMRTAFTFHKSERLCSKSIIEQLFTKGNRGFARFPFRFSWVEATISDPYPIQVLITVPRRNFPAATKRNRIKRQIRELYRLHKHVLYEQLQTGERKYALLIGYTSKEILRHDQLLPAFKQGMLTLKDELAKNNTVALPAPGKDL